MTPNLTAFTRLLHTAQLDGIDDALNVAPDQLDSALTAQLGRALDRWGYSLHHMQHRATLDDSGHVTLHADRTRVGAAHDDPRELAAAYAHLSAPNADGISDWPVLGEGHRTTYKNPAQLRVLVEDARDFETTWTKDRGMHMRVWRTSNSEGEILSVEYASPTDPQQLLANAAWDAMTAIKDRSIQQELLRRSESMGMLQAFLTARHKGAAETLTSLPQTHFAVQAEVVRLHGPQARDYDALKTAQKTAADTLKNVQERAVKATADLLRSDLR